MCRGFGTGVPDTHTSMAAHAVDRLTMKQQGSVNYRRLVAGTSRCNTWELSSWLDVFDRGGVCGYAGVQRERGGDL